MALTQITGPYPIFTDLDGSPLDDGYLYIGEINQDPETNPIQAYWDANLTIPATQPIRTNSGYAWRNGTPGLIYTGSQFSITIRNKKREFVLYSPVGYGFDPGAVSASVVKNDFIGDGVEVAFTLSASPSTKLATTVFINGVYQEKDSYSLSGNVITFSVAPPISSSIEVMTNETGVINSGNATAITYTASFPGAVQETVQAKLEQYVSVKDFGAVGNGVTDDTAAIQAAIDFATSNGNALYFPVGVYTHTSTLVWKNGVRYFGPNVNANNIKGAVLVYTGTDDANVINNPINSSTFASIRIENLTFVCNALSSGKALFYDTGSTYLYIEHCKFNFAGVGSFGLVFHQTEVSTISECIFEALGDIGLGALIRLADGPVLKHPAASVGYTNRITITNNQINPTLGGVQAIGLWDDGGLVHSIKDNNFNGGSISIYLLRPYPVEVANNEIEGYTIAGLSCGLAGAGLTGLRIVNNYFLAVPAALDFANTSIAELTYTDNVISVLGGGPCETNLSGSPAAKIFATNNREVSVGNPPFNNYLQQNSETVGSMLLSGSTTPGSQAYSSNAIAWRLIGDVCYFDAYIALSVKDPATAGEIRLTGLPYPHRTASATTTSVSVSLVSNITNSVGYTQTTACINPGESFIRLAESGSGVAANFLTAATIANTTQIAVSGMYPI